MLSIRVVAVSAAAALVSVTAAAGTAVAAGTTVPGIAGQTRTTTAAATMRWSRVTANGTNIIADIGLARGADGVLHVLWATGETSGGHGKVMDTPVSGNGRVGSTVTIISGQYQITDPDTTTSPTGVDAFWNGTATGRPSSPAGTFEATRPLRGGHWKLGPIVPPVPTVAYTGSSDSAATGSDGKPWVTFYSSFAMAAVHLGHPERQLPPSGCCVLYPDFGVDGHTGATWIAYQSQITHHVGTYAQRLSQAGAPSGVRILLPHSQTHGSAVVIDQRVAISGRGHGRSGVYIAYAAGWPNASALDLIRVGSRTPVRLGTAPAFTNIGGEAVSANPAGALWVTWFEAGRAALFTRVSNNAATKFGKTIRIKLPAGTSQVWKVYANAQRTRLDVVALLTRNGKTAYWITQVLQPR